MRVYFIYSQPPKLHEYVQVEQIKNLDGREILRTVTSTLLCSLY
jgi:hypothetical protein